MKLLLVSALFAIALSACMGLDVEGGGSSSEGPTNNIPAAAETPDAGDAASQRCGGGSLEGSFSY